METYIDELDDISQIGGQNQCLIFRVSDIRFGIMIEEIEELVALCDIFRVPRSKDFMLGVINIRGNVVGVVDILKVLRNKAIELDEKSTFIVLEKKYNNKKESLSFVANEVYEVIDIDMTSQKMPPEFGTKIDSKFIKFIFEYDGKLIEVLNTETLFMEAV